MINLKSAEEIKRMRDAALIAMAAMEKMLAAVEPGVSTAELDDIAYRHIVGAGAKPSFKGYGGFPGTACISVNDEIVHGIPGHRRLKDGDLVSFDTGAYLKGYHSDMARTVGVGKISEEAEMLIRVTKESFFKGVEQAVGDEVEVLPRRHARDAVRAEAVDRGLPGRHDAVVERRGRCRGVGWEARGEVLVRSGPRANVLV